MKKYSIEKRVDYPNKKEIGRRIKKNRIKKNKAKSIRFSIELRHRATKAERLLKQYLEKEGIVFYFQKPVHSENHTYIIDFQIVNIFGKKYAIEIDGESHKNKGGYDKKRSFHLYHNLGYCVKRFTNDEVINNIESVINAICLLKPKCIFSSINLTF